jgi:hypothetical protein
MNDIVTSHLDRLRTSLLTGYSLDSRADWICRNTRLRGEPFSFEGHEFQRTILQDNATEVIVRKCSQIGLSEVSARDALAMVNVMPGFTVIYTLPTAAFSKTFARTRVDPIIDSSPYLKARIHPDVDNGEVKQFGTSFLYLRGTRGAVAAISVPADVLYHDEYDFSDVEVLSNYQSRLTHSKWKWKRKFSTPTVEGWGISAEFDTAKQFWNMVKCSHCNHHFVPDYFLHVVVPGWDRELREINRDNLHLTRWRETKLVCPSCGKEPDMGPAHREWVVKNPDTNADSHAYQVQPFDAPTIITPPYLVEASIKYERYADFVNFNLGLPCEDKETSFSREELEALFLLAGRFTPYARVMGIDVGNECHVIIGAAGPEGALDVIHAERVPVGLLEKRKGELAQQHQVRVTVMDSMPYFDLLMRLQAKDKNLYGATYSYSKSLDVYSSSLREADPEKGRPEQRQVDINRNKAFDVFMDFVRAGKLKIVDNQHRESMIQHMMDMKRIKEFNADNELVFAWKKSAKGHDHWHHTLLYTMLAMRLLATAQNVVNVPLVMGKLKLKQQP